MSNLLRELWLSVSPSVPPGEVLRYLATAALLLTSLGFALPSGAPHGLRRRAFAILTGFGGLFLLWWSVPRLGPLSVSAAFWVFAVLTIASAAATIASRSPVYCAIWFAISLLGTAALLLLQGAQFLGVATIAVYAGAIVVTFLFVLMLAQPEGHAFYDRIGWGRGPRMVASLTAIVFAMLVAAAVTRTDEVAAGQQQATLAALKTQISTAIPTAEPRAYRLLRRNNQIIAQVFVAVPFADREAFRAAADRLQVTSLASLQQQYPDSSIDVLNWVVEDVMTPDHTAQLGGQLFTRQLIAVQAAGTLLMAALVGAVAIASRSGQRPPGDQRS